MGHLGFSSKTFSILIFFLIFSQLSCFDYVSSGSTEMLLIPLYNLADLLNYIRSIDASFIKFDNKSMLFRYDVLGEGVLGEIHVWKVNVEYGSGGSFTNATLWVDKSTGDCLKARMEGHDFSGPLADELGMSFFSFWMHWFYYGWMSSDPNILSTFVDKGKGVLNFLGEDIVALNSSQLLVYKYSYRDLPSSENYASDNYTAWYLEGWMAPTQYGGFFVRLYKESVEGDEWYLWKVNSIEFAGKVKSPHLVLDSFESSGLKLGVGEQFNVSVNVSNKGEVFSIFNNIICNFCGRIEKIRVIIPHNIREFGVVGVGEIPGDYK